MLYLHSVGIWFHHKWPSTDSEKGKEGGQCISNLKVLCCLPTSLYCSAQAETCELCGEKQIHFNLIFKQWIQMWASYSLIMNPTIIPPDFTYRKFVIDVTNIVLLITIRPSIQITIHLSVRPLSSFISLVKVIQYQMFFNSSQMFHQKHNL